MAIPHHLVRTRLALLLLGAYAPFLAVPTALAQDANFRILDQSGSIVRDITSSTGIAVYTTEATAYRFETWLENHPSTGVHTLWGRFVTVGPTMTGHEALIKGLYAPVTEAISTQQWRFGSQTVYSNGSTGSINIIYPILNHRDTPVGTPPSSIPGFPWDRVAFHYRVDTHGGTMTSGLSDTVKVPSYPNIESKTMPFGAMSVTLQPGVWRATEPSLANPSQWTFLFGGAAPSGLSKLQTQQIIYRLEIGPDPFKAGVDGGGGFDPNGIINAITQQTSMQEGYFSAWNDVYDKLWQQLTGGATEVDWIGRDARRDGLLTEIRDTNTTIATNTTVANAWLSSINTHAANIRTTTTQIATSLTQVLNAITPTQIPPQITAVATVEPSVEFSDIQGSIIDPDDELPSDWILPELPATTPSQTYQLTIPLASIPGAGMDNFQATIDMAPYHGYVVAVHSGILLLFTLSMVAMVYKELEKR